MYKVTVVDVFKGVRTFDPMDKAEAKTAAKELVHDWTTRSVTIANLDTLESMRYHVVRKKGNIDVEVSYFTKQPKPNVHFTLTYETVQTHY